jgi:hypothetical protein
VKNKYALFPLSRRACSQLFRPFNSSADFRSSTQLKRQPSPLALATLQSSPPRLSPLSNKNKKGKKAASWCPCSSPVSVIHSVPPLRSYLFSPSPRSRNPVSSDFLRTNGFPRCAMRSSYFLSEINRILGAAAVTTTRTTTAAASAASSEIRFLPPLSGAKTYSSDCHRPLQPSRDTLSASEAARQPRSPPLPPWLSSLQLCIQAQSRRRPEQRSRPVQHSLVTAERTLLMRSVEEEQVGRSRRDWGGGAISSES